VVKIIACHLEWKTRRKNGGGKNIKDEGGDAKHLLLFLTLSKSAHPNFFQGLKVPFFVMKSAFFCDEKCPFL
jgi:hypothetical protein